MRTKKDIARLSEIEDMLNELLAREEERKRDYGQRVADYEIKGIERELQKQAENLKKDYPGFDEEAELENEIFKRLLLAGLDMKTAYEAVHLDELKAVQQKAAADAAKKKALRPEENGSMSSGGALFKSGVYGLSRKERADLAKRAQKGEIIRF